MLQFSPGKGNTISLYSYRLWFFASQQCREVIMPGSGPGLQRGVASHMVFNETEDWACALYDVRDGRE
jgi:hypothetical protein